MSPAWSKLNHGGHEISAWARPCTVFLLHKFVRKCQSSCDDSSPVAHDSSAHQKVEIQLWGHVDFTLDGPAVYLNSQYTSTKKILHTWVWRISEIHVDCIWSLHGLSEPKRGPNSHEVLMQLPHAGMSKLKVCCRKCSSAPRGGVPHRPESEAETKKTPSYAQCCQFPYSSRNVGPSIVTRLPDVIDHLCVQFSCSVMHKPLLGCRRKHTTLSYE